MAFRWFVRPPRREEETGWRVESLKPLVYAQPANGITGSEHHVFRAPTPRATRARRRS